MPCFQITHKDNVVITFFSSIIVQAYSRGCSLSEAIVVTAYSNPLAEDWCGTYLALGLSAVSYWTSPVGL